jgi:enoyl-CoA hydratase/carnithine racemase
MTNVSLVSPSVAIDRRSESYWRVVLSNPPINILDGAMLKGLQSVVDQLESDDRVKVVVFESADPDYFISHFELAPGTTYDLTPGPTGLSPWMDFGRRLERGSFITVGKIRGRARGVGSEFAQALDIRFASRERAIFCQIEIGMALIPGGGGLERLHRLVGRSRAMEVITGAQDFDADTAERYGWVNRSVPDAELDALVERYATRVAGYDKAALALVKQTLNARAGLAEVPDLVASEKSFYELLTTPQAKALIASLFERGLQRPGDLELHLGDHLAP